MSKGLPPVCACAPAPALLAWIDGDGLHWDCNDAARDWPPARAWSEADWRALAQALIDQAQQGRAHDMQAGFAPLRVRWRASATDGGWLAWLLPEDDQPSVAPHAQGSTTERMSSVALDDTASVSDAQRHRAINTQLGLAVGLAGIALWRVDFIGQRIHLNDRGYELLGFAPRDEGLSIDEIRGCIHPDDVQSVEHAVQLAIASAGVVDLEARYAKPEGGYRTMLTRRIAERNARGEPIGLVGISLDISDRVQENDRARQAAQSIELIAEATGVGVWTTDLETRESTWNGQMWKIFGISPEVGLPQANKVAMSLADPQDRDRLREGLRELAEGIVSEEHEFTIRRTDGEVRRLVSRGRFAQHGEHRLMFGAIIDVTEQRTTQERLRRAEQRAMLAAQSVGIGVWERDIASGVTWWDAQMYRLHGLEPGDGRPGTEARLATLHPDDHHMVRQRLQRICDGHGDDSFEFRTVWPDGRVRWLATRGSLVRDGEGKASRLLGVNWDITEHKLNEDMRREKAAAEEASRAKSEFLSRMSHELRTPLNAVLGFAQLMLGDNVQSLPDRQHERAQRIRNAGQHLLSLIDDVLDLTSVEVGTVPLATRAIAVAPLVQETLQWLAPMAQGMNVRFIAGDLQGAVVADAKRLRQVVSNLLSNAVKYNRPGGTVEVAVMEEDVPDSKGPRFLGIRVRDSGRGLTPAQRARLFEPFNRLGVEREGIQGTGIGLTIVRALVEHMGGWVDVESEAGRGSEFRVWLPRAQEGAAQEAAELPSPETLCASCNEVVDVLYIEDNPVNVLLVQELVAMRPHIRLHTAVDGRSGVALARQLRPRAALIDLQLPDIDGFEVLRSLRADAALASMTCIALSASAMSEDILRAKALGFDDYWTKPINFGQFLGGLDRLSSLG